MRRRDFLRTVGVSAATAAVAGCAPKVAEGAKRPNVLFILTDDQRADCLGVAGHPHLETPHLDRLAAEGAHFTNMFVTTSLCSPSRASFLSGLYAHTHGVSNNFTDYPSEMTSWPMRLHEEGYETAYVGKWHMGEEDDSRRPGFDYWVSHKGQGKYFDTEFNVNGTRKVLKGYYTHVVTDEAVKWLERPHEKPWCLIVGHKASHTPFTPEPKYEDLFDDVEVTYPDSAFHLEGKPEWIKERIDTWHGIYGPIYGFRADFPDSGPESVKEFAEFVRAYWAALKSVDDSMGRIYETLKATGDLDNTLILFAGDNGMFLGEHGMTDKRSMHEESIRVPMLARYPALIRPGTEVTEQVLNIDLAPSVLEICGAEPLKDIHGASWKPLLAAEADGWRLAWYYEYNYEKQFPYTPNVRGVRTDEWKYMEYPPGGPNARTYKAELYNLKEDPKELHNLIDDPQYRNVVEDLKVDLARLKRETGAVPDEMPVYEGIKKELPEESIR
ncbi:MAG: sulfatase [Phycisphaerae bacterium]